MTLYPSFLEDRWRIKLTLSGTILQKADIFHLGKPTNYLGVINVVWVKSYLNSLDQVNPIIVSHDSGLLNDWCTHTLQIEDLKLHTFKGHLD